METKVTFDDHSDIVGGSTAGRVLACPGSVKLNQAVEHAHKERILETLIKTQGLSSNLVLDQLPSEVAIAVEKQYRIETTSEYAAEGTGLHEAIAWLLDNDQEPESVVDRTFEGVLVTPTLYSEAIVPALAGFDDYCEQVFAEDGEDIEFVIEKRCQFPGIPDAFGTADIIGKTSKRVVIWDWKFGDGVAVSPIENAQLRFYGRAAFYTMRDWLSSPDDEKSRQPAADLRIDLVISQPRIGDGEPQIWTTTYKDLEDFRCQLLYAVAEANADNAKIERGAHCRWCRAKHICPSTQQTGQRILERVNNALEDKPNVDVKTSLKTQEVQFTPQDLADWLQDAIDIEDWVKWVHELAREELKAGREVTGFELDQGLGNAAWTVDDKTVDRRLASYGIELKDRKVTKLITPTVARKFIKAMKDDKKARLLEKIIHRPPAALRMVPIGTAKNPVAPSVNKAILGKKIREINT